ncbi:MAG: hypothetical protein OHK0013_16780 [Sandaracinaceae bacterium]
MLIEIAVGVAAAAVTTVVARVLWARRNRAAEATPAPAAAAAPVRGPGLHPGDVLSGLGQELVLEAGSELDDGGFVLRVLEVVSTRPRHIVQLDVEGEVLVLAEPTTDVPAGRVADVMEVGGRVLGLVRRGHAVARPVRADRPPARWPSGAALSGGVEIVVLADRAGRSLIVLDAGPERLALRGDRLDRRQLDLLPGS